MTPPAVSETEQATRRKLLFALRRRQKPTVVFIQCQTEAKRDELERYLRAELPDYQFVGLDVTPLTVTSLVRTLADELPEEVKSSTPVRYVVNVRGLENRLDEQLAAQLNLERELLFRHVPYVTIVWADAYFFRRLQQLSPDLWHWVTYKFRFDDPTVPAAQAPLPPSVLPQKGNIEARQARIEQLEERYAHLNLDESNKIRLLRDKVNTLSLLADEYTEAFAFDKAIKAYETAIALETQVQEVARQEVPSSLELPEEVEPDYLLLGRLWFNLGWAYTETSAFERALKAYDTSKKFIPGQEGIMHHQIGIVYEKQQQWAEALSNYKLSLQWKEQTGKTFNLGATYHQIGLVYEWQRQWTESLTNYQSALGWYEQTGNLFALGDTYHQIGSVYQKQQQWAKALTHYQSALRWYEQTDNLFELGSTYHQIGRVLEEQEKLAEALEWMEKALLNIIKFGYSDPQIAEESVARVRQKLAASQ